MDFKKLISKHALAITALFFLSLFTLLPVFSTKGFPNDNANYDLEVHAFRSWLVAQQVFRQFTLPVWSDYWYGGFPPMEMYPPLAQFLFSPLYLLFEPLLATKLMLLLSHFLTLVFFYFLARRVFKANEAGWKKPFLATVILSFFPYKVFEISPRGAMAEATALMFLPLVFLSYELSRENPSLKRLSFLGLSLVATILSHYSLGFFALLSISLLFLWDEGRKLFDLKELPRKFAGIPLFSLLGLLSTAFFLLLAFQLKDQVNYEQLPPLKLAQTPFSEVIGDAKCAAQGCNENIVGGFPLFLISFCFLFSKTAARKYALLALVFLFLLLWGGPLLPEFFQNNIQFPSRFLSVVTIALPLALIDSLSSLNQALSKRLSSKFTAFAPVAVISLVLLPTAFDYFAYFPKTDPQPVPSGVYSFYNKIAADPSTQFYRVEDSFFNFGFSPALHHKPALNGGFYQLAPKSHFYFWFILSNATFSGRNALILSNLISAYSFLSVKYLVLATEFQIPGLKAIDCGRDSFGSYCIYENPVVLPKVRFVKNLVPVGVESPANLDRVLGALSMTKFDFSQSAFAVSNDSFAVSTASAQASVLEERNGYFKVKVTGVTGVQYLLVEESKYPGWKASVNGKPAQIVETIPSTMVIPVSEDGIVELFYSQYFNPPELGLLSGIVSLASVCVLLFFYFKK